MNNQTVITEFMEFVIPVTESGCWLWIGDTQDDFGHFEMNGEDVYADRVSWEALHGKIPNGLCICHKCNVSCCVNPDHLFLQKSEKTN